MSSKYFKSRAAPIFSYEWSSKSEPQKEYVNSRLAEKGRIEAIPLEELTFQDLYKFPFHHAEFGSWVYDANGNFIFQFEFEGDSTRKRIIDILNGDFIPTKEREVKEDKGMILVKVEEEFKDMILIRGWGNLTGTGAYNLDGEYAGKIQDTLSEFIVEKLGNVRK